MNMFKLLTIFLLSFNLYAFPTVPPVPGDYCDTTNPDFTELRYKEQIPYCERNVTYERKRELYKQFNITDTKNYTIDHVIPLSMGGSNDDNNIWPQHKSINVTQQEYDTYVKLRDGKITQKEAVNYILKLKFRR